MAPWSREKIAKTAQEVADHLKLVENVRALQQGQKEIADAIAVIDSRLRSLESNAAALKAEVKFEALKETQQALNSVQGAFYEKLTELAVRVAHLEPQDAAKRPVISIGKPTSDHSSDAPQG